MRDMSIANPPTPNFGPVAAFGFCAMLFCAAASGETAAAKGDLPPIRAIYDATASPEQQAFAFRNTDRFFPTRTVRRGADVHPLPPAEKRLDPESLRFPDGGGSVDLPAYLSAHRVSGLLVLKAGRIAFEEYRLGMSRTARWGSMSVVKSMTSTLIGAAIHEGRIASIDDPLPRYLPELAGTAYDRVTVRQLLQMASGVKWNEAYADPASDRRRMLDLQICGAPGAILAYMGGLPRAGEPGTVWNYSTGETHVAGALLRAAVGRPLAEYLSEKIWAKFGMESDATWWLESSEGLEVGGSGLSATLRDYGRFGLFFIGGGRAGDDYVLPEGWLRDAGSPQRIGGGAVPYGYMWWPANAGQDAIHAGALVAAGIFGQFLYLNPRENLVVVQLSADPKPLPPVPFEFFAALARALRD